MSGYTKHFARRYHKDLPCWRRLRRRAFLISIFSKSLAFRYLRRRWSKGIRDLTDRVVAKWGPLPQRHQPLDGLFDSEAGREVLSSTFLDV